MTIVVLIWVIDAVLAAVLTGLVVRNAVRWRLVQAPNHRSSHTQPTASGGGLGIVIAGSLTLAWITWQGQQSAVAPALLCALVLAGVGLADDIAQVPARWRFAVQIAVSLVVVGQAWTQLPPIMVGAWPVDGWVLAAVLVLACLWWVNLYNFMDGIDGLAAMQAIFMTVAAAILITVFEAGPALTLSSPQLVLGDVAAATAGFLLWNRAPARIFMGDVGSTWLGLMLFALALPTIATGLMSYAAWLILAATFLTDASVTLLRRLLRGQRWYDAHRSHAYQRLSRRWHGEGKRGHRLTTWLYAAINVCWLAPLAAASLAWPSWQWLTTLAAYVPLILVTVAVGAGKADHE